MFAPLLGVVLHVLFVLHPRGDREMRAQCVVELGAGDLDGVGLPVEGEDLVLLLAVVGGQGAGPRGQGGRRQQVDRTRGGT